MEVLEPDKSRIMEDASGLWDAVVNRDPAADGRFVYSVRTTGVYCRPSCPSRPARRENVTFHATGAEAERAGFRPCKRCRPEAESQAERHAEAVARACRLVTGSETPPSLDSMAQAAGLSAYHFHRIFKASTGITPRAYANQHRAARVAAELREADTITHAIYDAGFQAASRFYEFAPARLGMTPTAYRDGGAGAAIRFAVGQCSLGAILVAATAKGLCAITIGDDPDTLVRALQHRFAKAKFVGGDSAFEAVVARVVGLVEAPHKGTICRSTSEEPPSRSGSGRRSGRSRPARQRPMPRSPQPSARRALSEPSLRLARPTRSRSRYHVIASCAPMDRPRATAGASTARARFSRAKAKGEGRAAGFQPAHVQAPACTYRASLQTPGWTVAPLRRCQRRLAPTGDFRDEAHRDGTVAQGPVALDPDQ